MLLSCSGSTGLSLHLLACGTRLINQRAEIRLKQSSASCGPHLCGKSGDPEPPQFATAGPPSRLEARLLWRQRTRCDRFQIAALWWTRAISGSSRPPSRTNEKEKARRRTSGGGPLDLYGCVGEGRGVRSDGSCARPDLRSSLAISPRPLRERAG